MLYLIPQEFLKYPRQVIPKYLMDSSESALLCKRDKLIVPVHGKAHERHKVREDMRCAYELFMPINTSTDNSPADLLPLIFQDITTDDRKSPEKRRDGSIADFTLHSRYAHPAFA